MKIWMSAGVMILVAVMAGCAGSDKDKSIYEQAERVFPADKMGSDDLFMPPGKAERVVEILRQRERLNTQRAALDPQSAAYEELTQALNENRDALANEGFWKQGEYERGILYERARQDPGTLKQ